MFKNILNTTIIKVLNTLVSFLMLLITARALGPQNLGTTGLILLAINIILLLNNLVGGGALVFLVPRYSLRRIVMVSYGWVIAASVLGILIFVLFRIEPQGYYRDIFLLSLIFGVNFVNQNVLLGKELIRFFNLISFIQYILLISLVVVFFYGFKMPTISSYLTAMYISWGGQLLLGTIKIATLIPKHPHRNTEGLFRDLMKFGVFIQIANLTQFFSYRLTYYFVEHYLGRAKLGVFEIGNKLADGVWLFGKSISMVQYSWIANADEKDDTITLTLRLFRFSLVLSLMIVAAMVLIPESVYLIFFGERYAGLHRVLLLMAPGIVGMSASMIISHYFAGIGKYYVNTVNSILGLIAVTITSWWLIPRYGLAGAALAATITYSVSLLYNLITFAILTKTPAHHYLPSRQDVRFLKGLIRKYLQGRASGHENRM
ncbi:MAG TPA: polysaccharide biosynthesis C-terminal domain-containing protein [Bacteroidales bacterium]|nr:polysaccharide biosynthesis C-terminal domain-containing protein [Bacteroidales bacterium]HRZ50169.1 polysaccharide biosynthesis C-terminal domain-containing protein [Bacteroidales bacterium]